MLHLLLMMVVVIAVPAAGKTHLGLRLAELYGLLHVNPSTILAELQHMDPDTQKVCGASKGQPTHAACSLLALLCTKPLRLCERSSDIGA